MNLQNFRFETGADGVALLTWDMPGRSMNVITPDIMTELEAVIDAVVADAAIKGCVIASGKSAFSGGADLSMLQQGAAQYARSLEEQGEEAAKKEFFEGARRLSLLYRKLETCGKPFAIAIHGVCLGGAFELALACHYRVACDDAKVGLPEIKVGLFPGAGGTQRVARLMQTGDALQFLFKGEQVKAKAALGDEAAARGRVAGGDRRQGQGVDPRRRQGAGALGRQGVQEPFRKSVLAGRHDDLARRQRHLPPRDHGQLSGGESHSACGL